jgi:hypothetical protein
MTDTLQRVFTLRFITDCPALSEVIEHDRKHLIVNIHPFLDDTETLNSFRAYIQTMVIPIIRSNDLINYQGEDLRNDLRREILLSPSLMTTQKLVKSRDLFAAFLSNLWFLEEDQKIRWSPLSQVNDELIDWESGLYIRGGIVELRVVENEHVGMFDDHFRPNFPLTEPDADSEPNLPISVSERRHWLDVSDLNQNIRDLMTNAGWYSSGQFDIGEIRVWTNLYLSAYLNATGVFRCPGIDMFETVIERYKVASIGSGFTYLNFPRREKFYDMLDGRDVLFVTPFAEEIHQLFQSGKIWGLWTDLEIPKFRLSVIQAPMSIFPNRPSSSWIKSFQILKESIMHSFRRNKHSLFFASAGSYGIPICDFVYSTYDVASVYTGNYINYLFGVRQNATENDFFSQRRDLSNWAASNLGSIPGVTDVDDGRYVFTSKN